MYVYYPDKNPTTTITYLLTYLLYLLTNKILRIRIVLPGKSTHFHLFPKPNNNSENLAIHVQHFLSFDASGSYREDQELPCNELA